MQWSTANPLHLRLVSGMEDPSESYTGFLLKLEELAVNTNENTDSLGNTQLEWNPIREMMLQDKTRGPDNQLVNILQPNQTPIRRSFYNIKHEGPNHNNADSSS